jgi:hypothetical protein
MTKSPDLNEEERSALLRDLTEVGPSKPVGYLPLYTLKKFVRTTPEALAAAAGARGLATAQFTPANSRIKSGALYVYHREALADLLQANATTARAAGLPLEPDDFIARITAVWFEKNHPAYAVIAAAFGDEAASQGGKSENRVASPGPMCSGSNP